MFFSFLFFINLSILLLYLTFLNLIPGVDSWYWLKVSSAQPYMFNVLTFLFFLSIFYFFKKREILFLFFVLNPFAYKFLEVELDDYLFFLFSFVMVNFFSSKPLKFIVAFSIFFFYAFIHGFVFKYSQNFYLEGTLNTFGWFYFLPTFYFLALNKKFHWVLILFILSYLAPTGKVISTALPIITYAIYTTLPRSLKYHSSVLIFFFVFWVLFTWYNVHTLVVKYQNAENLCDKLTKVCYNTKVEDWFLGHYLAYRGYYPLRYPY